MKKEGEDYGYHEFIENIDTIILGRKTYDWVHRELGDGHYDNGERDVYVITRREQPDRGRIKFHTGGAVGLVNKLKSQAGKNIYCDGGGELINEFLKHDLIDELIISIVPILLGDGTRLFHDGRPEQLLEFTGANTFDTGLTQLHYKRKK